MSRFTIDGDNQKNVVQNLSYTRLLTFMVGGQLFGIPIDDVFQITEVMEITPLPDFPRYAKGVFHYHGNMVPVIDVRVRFGKDDTDRPERCSIIVCRVGESIYGFLVDNVVGVEKIIGGMISPPPKVSKDITNVFLYGITELRGKVALLVDIKKILTEKEFIDIGNKARKSRSPDISKTRLH